MLWHFCPAWCKIVAVLDSTSAGQRPLSGRGGSNNHYFNRFCYKEPIDAFCCTDAYVFDCC